MSSRRDIMDMVEEAAEELNRDPEEVPAPAPRFTHRVVQIDLPSGSDSVAFQKRREKEVHDRLCEIRDDVRRCADAVSLENVAIEIDHELERLRVHVQEGEQAQEFRIALIKYGLLHLSMPNGVAESAARDIQEFLDRVCREVVKQIDRRARKEAAERSDPPAIERAEKEYREPIKRMTRLAPMAGPETLHAVDEIAARLHASAPWLRDATTHLWRSLQENLENSRGPCVHPLLMYGPPGSGKTSLARDYAREIGAACAEIDVGAGSAAFRIAGSEKGWGSSCPGLPVQTVLDAACPNPVMIVNEICEAGAGMKSTSGVSTSIVNALLQLLDVESSARFTCPALRVPFDMSRVSWLLTANDINKIPPHLLSRVRRVYAPMPSASDVSDIVRRRLDGLEPDLVEQAAGLVAGKWKEKSEAGSMTLRQVEALCERVRRAANGPVLH